MNTHSTSPSIRAFMVIIGVALLGGSDTRGDFGRSRSSQDESRALTVPSTETLGASGFESFDRGYIAGRFIIPAALIVGLTIELLWFVGAFRSNSVESSLRFFRRREKRLP